jgi:hypothetical protein
VALKGGIVCDLRERAWQLAVLQANYVSNIV